MTERLYYDDAYTLAFNADVVERTTFKGQPALVLDRTYFYPESGGQPADNGLLNGVAVTDVQARDEDKAVLHVLAEKLPDQRIEGQIDAARRFDHMQHHSGQHILSQALSQVARAHTVSVHMGADSMTIDVNRAQLSLDDWLAIELLANQIIQENRHVRCWFPSADELPTLALRKVPEVDGRLRVVDIGGFDVTACGGTHVAHTGEIGLIKVVKYERRGETTRLEFRCGGRALADYRLKNDIIARLMAEMTVGAADLLDSVRRLQAEAKTMRSEIKAFHEQAAELEAARLTAQAELHNGYQLVVQAYADRSVNEVRLLAQKITAQPAILVLMGVAGDKAQLIFARADDVNVDVVPLLRQALTLIGCERGGGRPNFAQGGGVPASLDAVQNALRQVAVQLS